ncbi:hypothetical protein C0J52_25527 [Blattella germanica]|nr:hypothetical protein C0J52_25527 [Blattella germanica]
MSSFDEQKVPSSYKGKGICNKVLIFNLYVYFEVYEHKCDIKCNIFLINNYFAINYLHKR